MIFVLDFLTDLTEIGSKIGYGTPLTMRLVRRTFDREFSVPDFYFNSVVKWMSKNH